MIGASFSFVRRLWYGRPEEAAATTAGGGATVAVRSPVKPRKRPSTPSPVRRPKRGEQRGTTEGGTSSSYCSPDAMTEGTERIAAAHQVTFEVDEPQLLLRVSFPQRKRGGTKGARRLEEYDWIPSKEDLRARIALEGYANERATLLALAMEQPMLFWNAAYWCDGNVTRIEQELLVVL